MKNQAIFTSKDTSKKLKCCLMHFLFGALRVKIFVQRLVECLQQGRLGRKTIIHDSFWPLKIITKQNYLISKPAVATLKVAKMIIAEFANRIYLYNEPSHLDLLCLPSLKSQYHTGLNKNNLKIFEDVHFCLIFGSTVMLSEQLLGEKHTVL